MVGLLELVLDDDRSTNTILSDHIDGKGTCGLLDLRVRKTKVKLIIQDVDVVAEPGGEVGSLVSPHFAQRDSLDLADASFRLHYATPTAQI